MKTFPLTHHRFSHSFPLSLANGEALEVITDGHRIASVPTNGAAIRSANLSGSEVHMMRGFFCPLDDPAVVSLPALRAFLGKSCNKCQDRVQNAVECACRRSGTPGVQAYKTRSGTRATRACPRCDEGYLDCSECAKRVESVILSDARKQYRSAFNVRLFRGLLETIPDLDVRMVLEVELGGELDPVRLQVGVWRACLMPLRVNLIGRVDLDDHPTFEIRE